ncbi:MAG: hypothetical protein KDI44_05340 [Thiothrix sp.]|nr:hypothetical protein [Thiothrix sp.]HPQ96033.1 hypothetical protein [Thiolinea sp.]
MWSKTLLVAGLLSAISIFSSTAAAESLPPYNEFRVNFNQHQPQPYQRAMLKADWHMLVRDWLQNRAIVRFDKKNPGNHYLRVKYPANVVGGWHSGAQFIAKVPESNEYWLSYKMRFQPGFDFRKGGKLPGLGTGDGRYAGGNKPVKGDGWTARLMWLGDGRLVPYLYYVGMPAERRFGDYWPMDARVRPGQWQEVSQRVRVNTPGKRDGIYEVWVDGKLATRRTDIVWRYGNQAEIDAFLFSTFHGGASLDWAPRWDSYIDFDDFVIGRKAPAAVQRAWLAAAR